MEHPFLDPTFLVRWRELRAECVETDIAAAFPPAQAAIDAIAATPLAEVTYDNTLAALERATETLSRAWGYLAHLDSVRNHPDLRAAYNAMLPRVSDFFSAIPLNEALWARIEAFAMTPEAAGLDPVRKRHLEETLADFRDNGAQLPPAQKQRLRALNAELSRLTQKFSENVLDATHAWECLIDDPAQLEGLPESAKDAARRDARQRGHGTEEAPVWRFSLQHPSMLPVMKYADDDSLRRTVWQASNAIAATQPYDNSGLIGEIIELRQEKAEMLGYPHFPDYVLRRRMAKNGAQALAFVDDLHRRAVDAFRCEWAELEQFKAEQTGGAPERLTPWETAYWSEKRRRACFDFDEEAVKAYLPIDRVLSGMFELVERLFGVRISARRTTFRDPESGEVSTFEADGSLCAPDVATDIDAVDVWHPEVRFFDLHDADGLHLGSFYTDWFPRDSKRGGAWMNCLRVGNPDAGESHLGLMAGNLSRGGDGKPALMNYDEVQTIFHEFGHLLHQLLSRVPVKSLCGVNVSWDFVELPSQLMENWCWEREAIDRFARHYETGEPVPSELFGKMIAARNFMAGSTIMRQLAFAKMDLELHLHARQWQGRDLEALMADILEPFRAPLTEVPPTIARRFLHLFSDPTGYAAGYYSYLWAEVLDADAFTRFKSEGILNPETGRAFREHILERGNSDRPERLFRAFMGRDPDPQALLQRRGLVSG